MLSVGVTGTRQGGTRQQLATLYDLLSDLEADEFHHGDCIGVDAEAHKIALNLGYYIVIHPPIDKRLRAFCKGADEVNSPFPYLVRNRHIVQDVQHLFVIPKEFHPQRKGGTWFTYRYAREINTPYTIIWPNGRIKTNEAG